MLRANLLNITQSCEVSSGTTRNLRAIFIGRCHDFFNTIHKNDCGIRIKNNYNCKLIWNEFRQVIIGKDLCDIKVESIDKFFDLTDIEIGINKSLFWSGTYTTAHESKISNL